MIIFPLLVNVISYWLSDNLLKKEEFKEHEESLKMSFYEKNMSRYYSQMYIEGTQKRGSAFESRFFY